MMSERTAVAQAAATDREVDMASALGKVRLDELEAFLRKHGEWWDIDFGSCGGFAESLSGLPATIDDIIHAIEFYNVNSEFAFVFDDSDPPYDIINAVGLDNAELLDAQSLETFIIRAVSGRDFLWVAPSIEDASNGFYITLMPAESPETVIEEFSARARPLISAIEIANFKGISARVRLEVRPITLLFGQNSAGKSSLLHALIYAREVFERHNLDADRTLSAGDNIDLGGFRSFVHEHALGDTIHLRFDLDLHEIDLPIRIPEMGRSRFGSEVAARLAELCKKVKGASLAIGIRWSNLLERPYVSEYSIDLNGSPLATIFATPTGAEVRISNINDRHPLLRLDPSDPKSPSLIEHYVEAAGDRIPTGASGVLHVVNQADALPAFHNLLRLQTTVEEPNPYKYKAPQDQQTTDRKAAVENAKDLALAELTYCLDTLLIGPGVLLRDALHQFRYIGPQREVPPRDYSPPRLTDPSRWASGMAGWDLLFTRADLVERISRLMSDTRRLNLGYTLEQVDFREFDSRDRLITALQTNSIDDVDNVGKLLKRATERRRVLFRPNESPDVTLEPADLGVGVCQMIPALVAALDDQPLGTATLPSQLVAVEHPELNLHPRLQAELADVFLEGALSETTKGRIFFLETHSEVFTLRLFRRVRESHRRRTGLAAGDSPVDGRGADYDDARVDGGEPSANEITVKPTDVAVWYVDRSSGVVTVKQLVLDVEGEFVQPWPDVDSLFEQDFREKYT